MATITIDDQEYNTDNLSTEAKNQVASLQFVRTELNRLSAQVAVFKTAESAYAKALKSELDNMN
ncbi:Hypothetical protein NATL1_20981 [Prochlorococcus marinus str. NATL1A]|uniref:Uncharacterized protein n=1 Tax=Prochlorococcus marinus (strain NATL1A) TaxID=167555 RepID=A2C594_PROM1|nr:DUF6447 family protein [Prochlorococcus marinus]ABM76654.1 Hypothetical protein NATL1_20981 [Prochlorococcus marinus str. NATL1A]